MTFANAVPATATLNVAATIAIALPGGRCLRVAAMDGSVVIADGFGTESPLRAIAAGLSVPAELWPDVVRAVALLTGAEVR
jgi:hypothetical protein